MQESVFLNCRPPSVPCCATSRAFASLCVSVSLLSGCVQASWHGHWLSHYQWGAFGNHRLLRAVCWDRHQRHGRPQQRDSFPVCLSRWEKKTTASSASISIWLCWFKPVITSIFPEFDVQYVSAMLLPSLSPLSPRMAYLNKFCLCRRFRKLPIKLLSHR